MIKYQEIWKTDLELSAPPAAAQQTTTTKQLVSKTDKVGSVWKINEKKMERDDKFKNIIQIWQIQNIVLQTGQNKSTHKKKKRIRNCAKKMTNLELYAKIKMTNFKFYKKNI